SRPDLDPADYQSVDPSVYNRNLTVWSTYEPGSTFKIITLAAALEEQKVNLKSDQFYDKGHAEVYGARLRFLKRGGHGMQTY
ncbi:penicillin-binding transpeptidase domain-containing protein, partial [Bacillus spizizenii]|uniref:penicillin-binding transpeptidase domain-containing protein n=1 Tax=Bacillus spizizenii TaxID=96241 RepID=UPI0024161737